MDGSGAVRSMQEWIAQTAAGRDLDVHEAEAMMAGIMDGQATPAQIGALLIALRMKGETEQELLGCARAMRARAKPVKTNISRLVDTCGTGGDGAHTVNISTAAAFVLAGCGPTVAKHGNRSVSSRSGSADVLEELGVNLDLTPDDLSLALQEIGIAFLFAPMLHPAMAHAVGPRRDLGVRTLFNLLGPLTNPAGATHQLVGVYDPDRLEQLAGVMGALGVRRALVVHGEPGLDEVSICGPTQVAEWYEGRVQRYTIEPQDYGIKSVPLDALAGGDPAANAAHLRRLLAGEPGAYREAVLLNAAVALVAAEEVDEIGEGLQRARQSIDEGAAQVRLDALIEFGRGRGERAPA
ncbi:MAG: anthranilate phosphoribosyltransferase [Thermaerobacterales bacterium]